MLKIWMPLNGNTNNQGLLDANLKITNTTFVEGKFGTALQNGKVVIPYEKTKEILNNKQLTIAFWIYVNAEKGSKTDREMIFGNNQMTVNNNRKFSIFQYPTCNDLHLSWQNDAADKTFTGGIWTELLPSYTWTHVAVVYDNPNGYIYINGSLKYKFSGVSNSSSFAYETTMIHDSKYHMFNDYRIYDNALSAKEVYLLSKGLLCHYPLNQPERAKNIVPNSLIHTTKKSYGFEERSFSLVSGKQYTFFANGHVDDGDGELRVYLYTPNWSEGYFVKTSSKTDVNMKCQFTAKSTGDYRIGAFSYLEQNKVGGDVTINWYKVVEGTYSNINMQWSPCDQDNINWNENVEYDTSGFNNNGSTSNDSSPTLNLESQRNNCCYKFNGNSNFIVCPQSVKVTDELTVCVWGYMDTWNGAGRMFSCTEGGGWNIESNNGKISFPLYASGAYRNCVSNKTWASLNTGWHHFAITYDGFKSCIYLDGNLLTELNIFTEKTKITYHAKNTVFIGAEAGGDSITPVSSYFNGKLSDFRIYTTALSSDDILDIYNTPVSLTNSGTLITKGEFIE